MAVPWYTAGVASSLNETVWLWNPADSMMAMTDSVPAGTPPRDGQLEPNSTLKSRTTVHPKAVRVRVSFAQQITGLEEFLKRDFYVTLGDRPPEEAEAEISPGPLAESPEADAAAVQKATEQVLAVNATIAEEDLLPLPPPGESKAYWKQVSDLISRNWSRQIRSIRRSPSSETVRVHFKMYASGVAQLIQLEKSSGARDVNDAGLQTIIHAHPFPPIPPDVGGDIVDVHVRMRTGAKVATRDVQMTVDKKTSKPAASPSPKEGAAPSGSTKGVAMTNRTGRAVAMLCLGTSVLLNAAYTSAETARYDVDPDHSIVEFKVAHMVISKTTGHFKDYTGIHRNGSRCRDGQVN